MDQGDRLLLATLGHLQDPDILFRLRAGLSIDDEAPVPRPVGESFGVIRLPQQRLFSCATGCLLIEVHNHVPVGRPDDAAPVRRPDGIEITCLVEGEALGFAPRYVTQPEVRCAGLGIDAVGDKTLFVRGEPRTGITCVQVQRVDLLTATIPPAVLPALPIEARIKNQDSVVRDGKSEVIDANYITPDLV